MRKVMIVVYGMILLNSCAYTAVVNKGQKLATNKADIELNKGGNIIVLKDADLRKVPGALKKGDAVKVNGKKVKLCK